MIASGEFIPRFEATFSQIHQSEYGVACSSGTAALILALRALGVKKGDEVIVPDFTMVATAWAVSYVGATPVFVDCGPDFNIDVTRIEEKITDRTKAIMVVHIYGRQADMEAINDIASNYGLRVVEDSSEAHGVPLTGDIGCYSLYANKIITSGEGGICITNDEYFDDQMRNLRSMSFNRERDFIHRQFGYNFRMTNIQAAIALAQTERLPEILEKRAQIESWYRRELKDVFEELPEREVLWMYDVTTDHRNELMRYLASQGIETRMFFKPMTSQPMYKQEVSHPIAYLASLRGLYLPTYTDLTEQDVVNISSKIRQFPKFVV